MSVWTLFEKPLPAGSNAPGFEAADEGGKMHSLSELRGRPVLLVFYPGDDTPGCRKQLCEIRDSWEAIRARQVAVFGVNPQRAESHRRFAARHKFPFPILVDSGQRIAKLYRASGLMVKRTVVLIDAEGQVVFSERGMPPTERILQALPAERNQAAPVAR